MAELPDIRVGQGYDIHRLVPDRPLLLGGVKIDSPVGSQAHSDGDVLLHALIDALLGAVGLGDIGDHFPPTDERYRNADSRQLLGHVLALIQAEGFQLMNMDGTVFLEKPKLLPYKPAIRQALAEALSLPGDRISFKAKTAEKLGAVGQSQALAAAVTVLLMRTAPA
jgi:2-C-methyl-D-erythritol 2,4-cyclodiphosphate synthase